MEKTYKITDKDYKKLNYHIKAVALYPVYILRNYRRDMAIKKKHVKSIEKGEEPDDID